MSALFEESERPGHDECERPGCRQIAQTACEVYCDITGGKLSYPTYDTRTILAEANEYTQQLIDAELAEAKAENERLRSIVGGDGRLEHELGITLSGLNATLLEVRAENRRLIADRAANEKANIASRRSICEQSDRYRDERDAAVRQVQAVEALCDERDAAECRLYPNADKGCGWMLSRHVRAALAAAEHGPVPATWFSVGEWPTCQCGYAPRNNHLLIAHWQGCGFEVVDEHGRLVKRPWPSRAAAERDEPKRCGKCPCLRDAGHDGPHACDHENAELLAGPVSQPTEGTTE